MFDVFFSNAHGFEIDFPFLGFWIPSSLVYVIVVSVVALRVRKIWKKNKK